MPRPASTTARIHALDAGVGVANQRQQRVQSERENGEAVGARADPGRGQKKSEQARGWEWSE